mgnify:CR=1 FL=1
MHPPFLFWSCQKRNGPCTVQREKTLRRVGLRRRGPPAAGGGWLAVPCSSQGRKRPALGETSSPGRSGIHPASLFAAAGRWLMRAAAWANTTTSTTARAARSEAERAEREAGQMRSCTPTPSALSATGRQLQTRRRPKRARRPGKIGAGTTTPTPVRTEGHCTGVRPSALFFWTVHGPFSFRARPKRKWGVHPRWTSPLAGASPPWPPFGGPNHLRAVDNRPYAPAGSDPGIRHSPAGADLTQPAG